MASRKRTLPPTVTELLSMKLEPSDSSDPNAIVFKSVHPPAPMGFSPFSFGGCTLGMAATAACSTLSSNQSHFRAYSLLGNFMGPALVDRRLKCIVRKVRDTRTFATRMVELSQKAGKVDPSTGEGVGEERTCLLMTVDFQAPEKESALTFSETPNPRVNWGSPESAKNLMETRDDYIARGLLDDATIKLASGSFDLAVAYFDVRYGPESPLGQSLMGMARKQVPIPQQDLPHAERTSVDWIKCTAPSRLAKTQIEQLGALVFPLDFATSFIALAHDGQWLGDMAACSSLEFAFRIFENDYDMNEWHITQKTSSVGAGGRAYVENKIWDATGKKLLANMSQQVIMRPKPQSGSKM